MTINDILALSNAGFTKDDIMKLAAAPAQTPAQQPIQTPAPAPAITPAPDFAPLPAPIPTQQQAQTQEDSINKMLAEMSLLRQDIQNSNILNSQQPKVETVDDIVAKIINPPTIKKE